MVYQQFRPNYTAPPPLFRFGGIPMNLRYFISSFIQFWKCNLYNYPGNIKINLFNLFSRGSWQISRRDLNNPRVVAMVSTDRNLVGPTYDEYADSTSRRLMCFRSLVAIVSLSSHLNIVRGTHVVRNYQILDIYIYNM